MIGFLKQCWSCLRADSKTQTQYQHDIGEQGNEADRMEDDAINRSVLVVRPAKPFKRWAAKVDAAMLATIRDSLSAEERKYLQTSPEQFADDHTAYLIPLQDDTQLDIETLQAIYATIFERELFAWCTDQTQWPQPRTLALFRQWFDLELCGSAVDLSEGGIKRNRK